MQPISLQGRNGKMFWELRTHLLQIFLRKIRRTGRPNRLSSTNHLHLHQETRKHRSTIFPKKERVGRNRQTTNSSSLRRNKKRGWSMTNYTKQEGGKKKNIIKSCFNSNEKTSTVFRKASVAQNQSRNKIKIIKFYPQNESPSRLARFFFPS